MAGLLGDIYSFGDGLKRRLRGLLSDPVGSMQQALDHALPTQYEAQQGLLALRGQPYNPDAVESRDRKMENVALNFNPGAIGQIVWHGSPHKFDKFDMSKIGTGEGAQAYGHGLYMAEAPDVAKKYADELGNLEILHNNKVVGVFDKDPAANAAHQIRATGGDIDKAIKRAQNIYTGSWRDSVVNEIKKLGPGEVSERVNGQLYKVDIPDEAVARMLDWDKPLSQQAPEVQRSLNQMFSINRNKVLAPDMAGNEPSGNLIYNRLQELMSGGKRSDAFSNTADYGQDIASRELKDLGIQGIRYLDGGSRSAGQGSSNFVLFSDDLPRILEINGQATGNVPWKPNEWGGLLK